MNDIERRAAVLDVVRRLRQNDSWAGETHIQKTVYFIEELTPTDLGYEFVLYKHGPFSFDLSDELTEMRAEGLLTLEHQYPYGPRFALTPAGDRLADKFSAAVASADASIESIAAELGGDGVMKLERVATALFVSRQMGEEADANNRAVRLHEIKPHVDSHAALEAVQEVDALFARHL